MALTPNLVSGSSAKRPEPSGINAMPLVHKNSTGQPWVKPGDDDGEAEAMDFDLSEEQRLLRESVERLLADHYGFDKRRSYLAEPEGWSRRLWAQYAELGLLGLPFPEHYGGFRGGPIGGMPL